MSSDLGYVAKLLATEGLESVKKVRIEVGRPIRPMLAERMSIPSLILKKLGGRCGAKYKYDRERIQAHRKGDQVWLYSRKLENITHQFPDLIDFLKEVVPHDFIVELECVVIDPASGQIQPFQVLMNRKVKYVTRFHILKYPVAGFLFDILYLDGEDLTLKPYPERRKTLEDVVRITERINLATREIVDSVDELEPKTQSTRPEREVSSGSSTRGTTGPTLRIPSISLLWELFTAEDTEPNTSAPS